MQYSSPFIELEEMDDSTWRTQKTMFASWILELMTYAKENEWKEITDHILHIQREDRFISLVEEIFIQDPGLYKKMITQGSPEIANRRRALT